MAFRRGFKSQCERRAVELRKVLGLSKIDPLNAFQLANHFGITVWSTSDISGLSDDDIRYLTVEDDDSWSALTMRIKAEHLIIYKDINDTARINSVVMHELTHIILGHELSKAVKIEDELLTPENFSQEQENEADWFGGTLLLPRPALLHILKSNLTENEIREKFMVSTQMFKYRVNVTGVIHQLWHSSKKK